MFDEIIQKINSAAKIGLFAHINPDGDALGSLYSMKNVLSAMQKRVEIFLSGEPSPDVFELIGEVNALPELEPSACDLLIALDSADIFRLGSWREDFENHPNTAAIDHHKTHVEFAEVTVVDDVSSNCEILYNLYKKMGVEISKEAATALYTGIATDTGCFKYSSVTAETHRVAAQLIESGAEFSKVCKRVFDTNKKEYLDILKLAISKLKYYADGKIAYLCLTPEDFDECGITESESAAVVSLPGSIYGVEVSVYVRRRANDEYKVSLRASSEVDVAEIATKFGGGGHTKAAGFSLDESQFASGTEKLISLITEKLETI